MTTGTQKPHDELLAMIGRLQDTVVVLSDKLQCGELPYIPSPLADPSLPIAWDDLDPVSEASELNQPQTTWITVHGDGRVDIEEEAQS